MRYIDADKLIKHIKDLPTWWSDGVGCGISTKYPDGMFKYKDVIYSIENAETADVAPVFKNDPFAIVWKAFKTLFPDKQCTSYWESNIANDKDGAPVYGLTSFDEKTEEYTVFIDINLSIENAVEIYAHELAHVAAGMNHDHDEVWEKAFEDLFVEYNRIGEEMIKKNEEE